MQNQLDKIKVLDYFIKKKKNDNSLKHPASPARVLLFRSTYETSREINSRVQANALGGGGGTLGLVIDITFPKNNVKIRTRIITSRQLFRRQHFII